MRTDRRDQSFVKHQGPTSHTIATIANPMTPPGAAVR
jgi:hypothetical protein